MLDRERGSSSVLFMGFVIPVAFLFLALSLELQQFFGFREEIQRLVDERARMDVSREWEGAAIATRLQRDLSSLSPYIQVDGVKHKRADGSSSISVASTFRGMFTQAFASFSGGQIGPGISFSVYATARQPRASVLLAVDRTIRAGESECENPELMAREKLAGRLITALHARGIEPRYGTFPAGEEGILLLGPESEDPLVLCARLGDSPFQGSQSLRGFSEERGWGIDSAFGVATASLREALGVELSTVVMLTRNDSDGMRFVFDTASIIAAEPISSRRKTKVVGFVTGDPSQGAREIWGDSISGVDLRIVPIAPSVQGEHLVEAAFVHDVTSQVVMVR